MDLKIKIFLPAQAWESDWNCDISHLPKNIDIVAEILTISCLRL